MPESGDERLTGILLGTALGDALGLPCEGMSARAIARRFGKVDRFRLLFDRGFVSDDTEQSALIAQSLARHPDDVEACVRAFRRSLFGWFCRLPWGVGKATLFSCVRIGIGLRPTGVRSAGNGAAMRSAIVGGFFRDRPHRRREFARALAEVTHRDPRAVEGAVFVAEVAALAALGPGDVSRIAILREAGQVVEDPTLATALGRASELAADVRTPGDAARECGTSGYVVETLAFASYCFARFGDDPMQALTRSIQAGGDTDSIAAILGGWLGALHGPERLDATLLGRIHDGPFGPSHLRALGDCLAGRIEGRCEPPPSYSITHSLARNLALYPVVVGHGLRRLLPI
jgi:ADP-ribosylglycohydrolase